MILGDALNFIKNGAVITQKDGAQGLPITRIETLSNGRFNRNRMGFADIEDEGEYSDFILDDKDLLMSHINSKDFVGRTVLYEKEGNEKIIHGMNLLRLKTNPLIFDSVYAYYWFQSPYYKKSIYSIRKDAVNQSSASISDIVKIKIDLPDLNTQKKVADLLYSIDRQININKKIIDKFENVARLLYNYWMVQFDFPNEDGKPYKYSGGKMIFNNQLKREIPLNWSVKTINELCDSYRGVTYDKSNLTSKEKGILVLRGNNIENNHLIYDSNVAYVPDTLVSKEQNIHKGDIIMTMSSGSKEHIGKSMMFLYDTKETYGAFLNKFSPKECPQFIFLFFTSDYFKALIKNICNGTGINNLTNQTFDTVKTVYPPQNIMNKFTAKTNSIYETIGKKSIENLKLEELRDYLLPLLMNGQVKV